MPTIHTTNDNRRAIHIDLQSPHDYFTNDDIVRGTVCVHPTARPNGILLVFSGRCQDHSQNTLTLFSTQRLLFDSGTNEESYAILDRGIARSGKVELPFEFRFPGEVEIAPGDWYQPRPGFEHEEGHPLPPSMAYGDNKVEYVLEVAVYKKLDWSPNEVITLTLPFRPTPAAITSNALVQHPEHSEFCIRGRHLNPGIDSNPSALTKLKWATLSKYQHSVAEARWKIRAHCPFLLVPGTIVPISFAFHHLDHSSELREAPKVYVRRVRVKLTSLLAVRVPYGGPIGEREVMDDIEDIEREIFHQSFSTTNTIMRHGLQLAEIGEFILPPTVLPSFKTYGLRLVYRIKVVVDGHVSQHAFSVTALRDFCKIVCDVRLRERAARTFTAGSTSRLPSPRLAQMAPVPEEQPPAYGAGSTYEIPSLSGRCWSQGASTP
jgi:hypothetical protein